MRIHGFQRRRDARSDEELMALVGRGRHAALDELYARYASRLVAYFGRMLDRDEALAQDFLHDLFVKIIERPELFDARRPFRTWIYSAAHNMCKNEYRRRGIRRHDPIDDLEIAGVDHRYDESIDRATFARILDVEIDALDPDMRTTFLLRHQEDLSIREISAIVGVPEGTVKSRLFNTARRLSHRLGAFHPDRETADERYA